MICSPFFYKDLSTLPDLLILYSRFADITGLGIHFAQSYFPHAAPLNDEQKELI